MDRRRDRYRSPVPHVREREGDYSSSHKLAGLKRIPRHHRERIPRHHRERHPNSAGRDDGISLPNCVSFNDYHGSGGSSNSHPPNDRSSYRQSQHCFDRPINDRNYSFDRPIDDRTDCRVTRHISLGGDRSQRRRTRTRDSSLTRTRDSSPFRTRDSSPSRTRDSSPFRTRDPSPFRTRDSSPFRTRDSSPFRTRDSSPFRTRDSSPFRTRDSSPFRTRDSSPFRTRDSSPSRTRDLSPSGNRINYRLERDRSPLHERDDSRRPSHGSYHRYLDSANEHNNYRQRAHLSPVYHRDVNRNSFDRYSDYCQPESSFRDEISIQEDNEVVPSYTHSESIRPIEPSYTHSEGIRPIEPSYTHSESIRPIEPSYTHSESIRPIEPSYTHSESIRPIVPSYTHSESIRSKPVEDDIFSILNEVSRDGAAKSNVENDEETLIRRQKNIDYCKVSEAYDNYIKAIPKNKRKRCDPRTPDKFTRYSRRSWDGAIKAWKINIHKSLERIGPNGSNEICR